MFRRRIRYRMLLGHVYLPGGQMLNEEIVKAGYASVMTIPLISNSSRSF
jgi:endonuclease YncB( thermonuclease family)